MFLVNFKIVSLINMQFAYQPLKMKILQELECQYDTRLDLFMTFWHKPRVSEHPSLAKPYFAQKKNALMSSEFLKIIRNRRSVFPAQYNGTPVDRATLELLLEQANWAPTHRLTEPWRYRVFHEPAARQKLGDYLAHWYKTNTPEAEFSAKKFEKNQQKPVRSAAVLAICMQRDPEEKVPEWEELAAVACSVQNLWLSCSALGLGGYWSSPPAMMGDAAREFLQLPEDQKCFGLFYLGHFDLDLPEGKRGLWQEKVEWMD